MGFEWELERGLPRHGIVVGLHRTLKDGAFVAGGLPDFFERAQPMQVGQPVTVLLIAFVMVAADAVVFARIAHDRVGDVRPGDLGQPAAQTTFLQRQMFDRRGDELAMFD